MSGGIFTNCEDQDMGIVGTLSMAKLPKLICRFSAALLKIPTGVFAEIDKMILKLILKSKQPRIAKTSLKKNSQNKLEKEQSWGNFLISKPTIGLQ